MTSQFYDLSITKLEDGTIRLEQRDCGDSAIIDLHPIQAAFIANDHPANTVPERIATLERRLLWVRDRFEECHAALPGDMYERCPEAFEFGAWLDASVTVAGEFCADFADALSNATSKPNFEPVGASLLPSADGCLPSAAKSNSGHPDQLREDLFSDRAGRMQDGSD
jgi:hypothetical protein